MKNKIKKKTSNLEHKIFELSDTCYKIITKYPSIEKHAFEFLNFRNAHPSSLNVYSDYFKKKYNFLLRFKLFLKDEVYKFISFLRNEKLYFGDEIPKKCDVIFITHFLNKEQAYHNIDNYYGSLMSELVKDGKLKLMVVLKNHTWLTQKKIIKKWNSNLFCKIILSRTIGFKKEKEIVNRLKVSGKFMKSCFQKKPIEKNIALFAEQFSTSGSSKTALRMHEQIKSIVKKTQPKFLISTFEGHGWERLVFKAAKMENPNVLCIGYHHSVMFPMQLGLTRKYGDGYDPDIIATAGKIGLDWFKAQDSWKNTPINILGSSRSSINTLSKNNKICLVCPEGIISETLMLFKLAINAAKKLKKYHFILRVHPVLKNDKKINKFCNNSNLPDNVNLSKDLITNDLNKSKIILYRGSSLVITGVLAGLYPIYFSPNDEKISIDPLSSIFLKNNVNSFNQLVKKINEMDKIKNIRSNSDFMLAKKYCESYFTPISKNNFYKIINF